MKSLTDQTTKIHEQSVRKVPSEKEIKQVSVLALESAVKRFEEKAIVLGRDNDRGVISPGRTSIHWPSNYKRLEKSRSYFSGLAYTK